MPDSNPQTIDKDTIFREWKHILPMAFLLAGNAGYVNSVVLGFFDTPVSHMSGAVSRMGQYIIERRVIESFESLLIIFGFVLGSIAGGALIGTATVVPARRYGVAMMLVGLLLLLSTISLFERFALGLVLASIACGLQNAASSSYCGLAIRTTHVTGVVSDLGVMIGQWLRHRSIEPKKFKLLSGLLLSFGLGGVLGALGNAFYGPACLVLAAFGCLLGGAIYSMVMQRQLMLPDGVEAEPLKTPNLVHND